MSYYWPRVARVAPGDAVTSTHLASVANAMNARLRSGLGDMAWRVMFYTLGLWRQVRNPDADGNLWPPLAEFFESYQNLPESAGEWPVAGPGDPEGANVGSPVPAYVFGNEGANLYDEAGRLNDVPLVLPGGIRPQTALEFALLGEFQRGAFDPATGAAGCPAWNSARSWAAIRYGRLSPHLTSWAGFIASPKIQAPDCEDPVAGDGYGPPPNYAIFFTPTAEGFAQGLTVKTYAGTCQEGVSTTEDYSAHVFTIVSTPWAYYVILNDGSFDTLSKTLWTEGPYDGQPLLRKTEGQQIPRALQSFSREFRGAAQQQAFQSQAIPATWNAGAFQTQEFLTRQYALAPQRGHQVGNSVVADYTHWQLTVNANGIHSAGTVIPLLAGGGLTHTVPEGCALAGMVFECSGLADVCRVSLDGNAVDIVPDTDGNGEALLWFRNATPAGVSVKLTLTTAARWKAPNAGYIRAKAYELAEYKPDLSDLALVLRLGGAVADE